MEKGGILLETVKMQRTAFPANEKAHAAMCDMGLIRRVVNFSRNYSVVGECFRLPFTGLTKPSVRRVSVYNITLVIFFAQI